MFYGIIAGVFVMLASIFGSSLAFIFKNITHKTNDTILGFAAGIMLAAAFEGLLPTAFEQTNTFSMAIGIAGVLIGATFISMIDKFVPHIHLENGDLVESESKSRGGNKVMLLIIAIAIHNIPEGLATGIVFSEGITKSAMVVAISMVLQKIPEGLVVAIPLLSMGVSKLKAFGTCVLVALMMLPGVIGGVVFGAMPPLTTAFFYAFTFGAIVYVVSDEIIPGSHSHGYQKTATFALIIGILAVVILQNIQF